MNNCDGLTVLGFLYNYGCQKEIYEYPGYYTTHNLIEYLDL